MVHNKTLININTSIKVIQKNYYNYNQCSQLQNIKQCNLIINTINKPAIKLSKIAEREEEIIKYKGIKIANGEGEENVIKSLTNIMHKMV